MNDQSVQVRIPPVMRPLVGGEKVIPATGATVRAIVADIGGRHAGLAERILDEDGELHRFVNVFVGDEDVRYLDGLDTPVPAGTEISIIPAVAGG